MANLKSGLILTEGEELILELEAELWATSNNALARIWGKIQKFLALIMGHKRMNESTAFTSPIVPTETRSSEHLLDE